DSGDDDVIILGDLNAYRMEDAIRALEDAGYTDLIETFVGDDAYSFLFDGQLGYLDHALANQALLPQVTGTTEWHINADELPLLDYNDDVDDAGEASFERESGVLPLFEPTPYRSSDHDAVIVGLNLGAPTADAGGPYTARVGRTITLDATGASDLGGGPLTYAWDLDGDGEFDDATGATPTLRASRPPGEYVVSVQVTDEDGRTDTASAPLTVTTGSGMVPPGRR
ncbi:MAG TPA: PKD domain-containing protein, partial [Euzebya sp.]|nr:PKD domain-containing protein [Euzebya sp.]